MILKMPQNKSSANTLNSKVRKFFNFTKDNYKSDLMTLSTSHPGPKGEKTFVHLTCEQCLKKAGTILKSVQAKIPLYDRHKPVAVQLINNWDRLKLSFRDLVLVGCMVSDSADIHSGPNCRQYFDTPRDHWNQHHSKVSWA